MADSNPRQPDREPAKKTALMELRVSPEEKAAFMAVCQARGRSASDVLRTAMRRYSDAPRRNRRIVMTVSSLVPAVAGALWLAASLAPAAPDSYAPAAAQAEAVETNIALTLVGGDVRGLESTYLIAAEPREIVIDDIAAADLAPVFGPLPADTASLVLVLTARRDGPGSVTYDVTLNARSGDRMLLDEPVNPVLTVGDGEAAQIEMLYEYGDGGPAKGLSISLTPAPVS